MKILAIEDDEEIRNVISLAFDAYWRGSKVLMASDGAQGLQLLGDQSPEFVILDLGLPDGDGLHLCQEIRELYDVPIIIVTARDREVDVVEGLKAGAEDYVTKPFSPKELVARVWAVARRRWLPDASEDSLTPLFAEG